MLYVNGISETLSLRNNTKSFAVAIVALLALSAVAAVLPAALANLPTNTAMPDRDTGTVVGVSPTLVGLTQDVLINIMTYPAPSGPTYYAQSLVKDILGSVGLDNISVTFTHPDGTKETFMPIDQTLEQAGLKIPGLAQIVGSLQFHYKPTQVGTYSVTASFPGKTYYEPLLNLSVYYKPSSARVAATFTVQEDIVLAGQLNGWPWSPLPNAYWENPVSTNNREWAAISGDWVQPPGFLVTEYFSKYNYYSTAPNSPHILWANQVSLGGLLGGFWGSLPYGGGGGAGNIILDGKIYQNDVAGGTFQCVNLRTGEVLWHAPGSVSLAQRIDPAYQTITQVNEGSIDVWLWDTTPNTGVWKQYEPFTGALRRTIINVPKMGTTGYLGGGTSTPTTAFMDGNPIVIFTEFGGFNTTRPNQLAYANLIKWDLSKLTETIGIVQVTSNDWTKGIVWNVSVTEPNEPGPGDNGFHGFRAQVFPEANVVVVKSHNDMQYMAGYDLTTGAKLWKNNATVLDIGVRDPDCGPNGPIILLDGVTQDFVAYNVKTGQEQWRASMGELPWAMIPNYNYVVNFPKRVFYYGSYDGYVYAVNADTGVRIWQSDYIGEEFESIYNNQPFNGASVGADGKLYFSTATTYSLMPRTRFHALVAIDEATGKFLWKMPIGIQPSAIADGYLIGTDGENGMQYAIGKGKTATTVSASPAVGSGVTIQGTVMDMSPGQLGTAAVSEADMSEWMDYLHGQNATLINSPPTPTGVVVQLTAVGPDGAAVDLGMVTSDSSGLFKKMWKPTAEGEYTIYATFAGSDSYWASYAETALGVGPAASSGGQQPTNEVVDNTMTIIGVGIALAIIIAIVGALLFLTLRKR